MSDQVPEKETSNPHMPPWARFGFGRIIGFLFFFLVFFGAMFLFNLYVITRLFSMLGLRHDAYFLIFTVLSSMSFAVAMGLRTTTSSRITKGYYFAAATWLGFLMYFLFASFAFDIMSWYLVFDRALIAYAFIAGTVALASVSLAIPYFVVLREIEIASVKLGRELKIVHMSDIHVGSTHGPESLGKLVKMANDTNPDLVLITGDLADSPMPHDGNPFAALDGLSAPTFFCLGNHEYYAGIEDVTGMLAKTKVRVLRNEAVTIDDVQVIGLDYGGAGELKDNLARLPIDRARYTVLMYHQPDGFDEASAAGVGLMLCGHTHGGQFFPFTGINRLVWGKEYRGLHKIGGMHLYTSTGAGTWGPPMRLGTRSEIALIKVKGRI